MCDITVFRGDHLIFNPGSRHATPDSDVNGIYKGTQEDVEMIKACNSVAVG